MLGGIGVWQLLIVLLIAVLIFGTKRLRNMGGDLGTALRSFRKAMDDTPESPQLTEAEAPNAATARRQREKADT